MSRLTLVEQSGLPCKPHGYPPQAEQSRGTRGRRRPSVQGISAQGAGALQRASVTPTARRTAGAA
ncbi:hypothetical protein M4J06_003913 [Streptomyces coelicoflavus]|uniref:hypothetical protein n=1 Tax=Streptomyces coelicoflavus TaxID=285562 RepID=UPI0021093EDF|nr:hypothetical protein [Streptomyces coelicoflavus]MCQ4200360.1 hypothetical protein [Streptomyces coelicoflavus]